MHGKNKESFNRAQSFLKKEGGRILLGMKDFLGKEVFKRREVLTNKRGEGEKKKKIGENKRSFSWWEMRLFRKHFSFFKKQAYSVENKVF